MSENSLQERTVKTDRFFPIVIAITALILSITSGVVNYRQNNLTNLESSLRDTRDQLQLAKNDITDIKVKTIKQLVDADFAIKNQQIVKKESGRLSEALADAKVRINELEDQIRRMDRKLVSAKASLKAVKKKHGAAKAKTPKPTLADLTALITASDLDIYTQRIAPSLQQSLGEAMRKDGFKPAFPSIPAGMDLAESTSVFFYDTAYKPVAEKLVKTLTSMTRGNIILHKGASQYPKNKIILHLIGN